MAGSVKAQVYTYAFSQPSTPPPYAHATGSVIAQSTGATGPTSLDDVSYAVTLPFIFNFGNSAFTTVNVSTNGSVSFGSNNTTSYTAISDNTLGGGVIAAFNTDLKGVFATTATTTTGSNVLTSVGGIGYIAVGQTITGTGIPSGTTITAIGSTTITMSANATATSSSPVTVTILSGHINVEVQGSSPNRIVVIEWAGFQLSGVSNTFVNFQVQLSEASGNPDAQVISIKYGESLNPSSSGTVQVGLRGNTGNTDFNNRTGTTSWTGTAYGVANAATVSYSSANMPFSGLWFQYNPPPACTGTPTAGTVTSSSNPVCAGTSTTLTLAGFSTGTGIGLQWMSSTDNVAFTNIAGATLPAYVATPGMSTMYYKAVVTCFGGSPASSNTVTVTISNVPITGALPFRESFENWITTCATTDRPGSNWFVTPNTGNNSWRRDDQGASASWTSAASGVYSPVFTAVAHSGRFHTSGAASGQQGTMDAYINFSPAGNKLITFDYINATGSDTLFVELSTNGGTSFTALGFLLNSATWTTQSYISAATASNVILRFRAKSDFGSTDIGVDNLNITACLAPTALSATTVTTTSVNLGFTSAGTPPTYQIQYGSPAFTLGTGTNVFTSSNPYLLTGLTSGTPYSFFVRSICGPGDTSAYSTRFVFNTQCTNAALPYSEQFNTFLPTICWSRATGQLTALSTLSGTTSAWTGANYANSSSIGNPAARINLNSNTKREWLITPSIDLGTPASGTSYAIEFNAISVASVTNGSPTMMGADDTVAVVVSTDNGATWSTNNIVALFTGSNTPYGGRYAFPLDGYSGVIRVGFYGSDGSVINGINYDVFVDSILISNCSRPVVFLGNDTVLCPAQTITLDAGNAGSSYLYSNNATTQTTGVTAIGGYSVRVINPRGCIGRDTIVLTAGVNPAVNLGNDTAICPRDTITLNAGNPGLTYLFSNGAATQTTRITTGAAYTVAVTNATKCVGRDTIVIAQALTPVVNLGNDTVLCPAQTITLNAGNAGSTYLYSTGAAAQTTSITTAGTYSVRVTNANKCVGRDTIIITSGVNPIVNLGNDTLVCPGDTVRLNAGNAGSTYLYSNGALTQIAPVTTGGTYSVRVTNANKCVGRDTILISNGVNPAPRLGNDTALCPAQTITLNGGNFGAGFTYLYSNNATTQTTSVTSSGTYILRVTNLTTGCRGRDTIVISAASNPVVNLGNDTVLCPAQTITLNAGNAGSTYLYNTGAATQAIAVTTAGIYSVRVTNITKCISRDTIVITPGTNPIVNLGNDTAICAGMAVTLDAGNPGSTYLYSTGATTQTMSVIPSGSYSVIVTNAEKCVGRDTINISVIPAVSASSITPVQTGSTVSFSSDAQNTTSYRWSFGDGGTDNVASPAHNYTRDGNYRVMLIVANQCGFDTVETVVNVTGLSTGGITLSNKELGIYPNPATASITLDNKSALKMQSVTVLNALGQVMLTKDGIAPKKESLDIRTLPAGTYMVRIQTDGGAFLRRMQVVN